MYTESTGTDRRDIDTLLELRDGYNDSDAADAWMMLLCDVSLYLPVITALRYLSRPCSKCCILQPRWGRWSVRLTLSLLEGQFASWARHVIFWVEWIYNTQPRQPWRKWRGKERNRIKAGLKYFALLLTSVLFQFLFILSIAIFSLSLQYFVHRSASSLIGSFALSVLASDWSVCPGGRWLLRKETATVAGRYLCRG